MPYTSLGIVRCKISIHGFIVLAYSWENFNHWLCVSSQILPILVLSLSITINSMYGKFSHAIMTNFPIRIISALKFKKWYHGISFIVNFPCQWCIEQPLKEIFNKFIRIIKSSINNITTLKGKLHICKIFVGQRRS